MTKQTGLKIVKALLIVLIMIIVLHSLIGITHDINGPQLRHGLSLLTPHMFIILAILGCVAVTPMLTYDFVLVKILNIHKSKSDVVRVGFFVNTLNNLLGFGGVIGIGLRYAFYKQASMSKDDIRYGLAKLAIFLMSGLSLSSWIALFILIATNHYNLIWLTSLLVAGCYTPGVLIYMAKTNKDKMKLPNKLKYNLMLGSLLEWIGCSFVFIAIGYALGLVHNPLYVFAIFIVANVLGIISMVPGGLGMFETVIITGLANNINLVLIWLLLYRLFYYLIPILIGLIGIGIQILKQRGMTKL